MTSSRNCVDVWWACRSVTYFEWHFVSFCWFFWVYVFAIVLIASGEDSFYSTKLAVFSFERSVDLCSLIPRMELEMEVLDYTAILLALGGTTKCHSTTVGPSYNPVTLNKAPVHPPAHHHLITYVFLSVNLMARQCAPTLILILLLWCWVLHMRDFNNRLLGVMRLRELGVTQDVWNRDGEGLCRWGGSEGLGPHRTTAAQTRRGSCLFSCFPCCTCTPRHLCKPCILVCHAVCIKHTCADSLISSLICRVAHIPFHY